MFWIYICSRLLFIFSYFLKVSWDRKLWRGRTVPKYCDKSPKVIFRYDLMAHFSVILDNNHKMSELKFFIGYLAKITILQTRKQTDIHLSAYCNLLICQRNSTEAIHSKTSKMEVSRRVVVCVCTCMWAHVSAWWWGGNWRAFGAFFYWRQVLVTYSCLSLCDSMDYSPLGSSVHGLFQARILEWIDIPFSRVSSWPKDRTCISCIAGRIFTIWAAREALTEGRTGANDAIWPPIKFFLVKVQVIRLQCWVLNLQKSRYPPPFLGQGRGFQTRNHLHFILN